MNVPKNIVNFGLGFPKRAITKLKYSDTLVLTSNTGTISHYKFGLNTLYDPNTTGTGHQPMMFDQMMQVYNHFTVIASKITVRFIPYEANTIPTGICLSQDDDNTITPTSWSSFQEQSKAKTLILGSDGGSGKTLTMGWSAKKTYGGSVLANNLLRGNVAADPTEKSFALISLVAADNVSTVSVAAQVYIEYVAVFSELRDVNGS